MSKLETIYENKEEVKEEEVTDQVKEELNTQSNQIPISKVPVENDVMALRLLIAFAEIAYKRQAYKLDESAKLHEVIEYLNIKLLQPTLNNESVVEKSD